MGKVPQISDAEWEGMKAVWRGGPLTAGEVVQRVAAERFPACDEDDVAIPGLFEILGLHLGHGFPRTGNQHAALGHFGDNEEFARPIDADRRQRHPLQALGRGTAAPRPVTFAPCDAQEIVGAGEAARLQIFMTKLRRIETFA